MIRAFICRAAAAVLCRAVLCCAVDAAAVKKPDISPRSLQLMFERQRARFGELINSACFTCASAILVPRLSPFALSLLWELRRKLPSAKPEDISALIV